MFYTNEPRGAGDTERSRLTKKQIKRLMSIDLAFWNLAILVSTEAAYRRVSKNWSNGARR